MANKNTSTNYLQELRNKFIGKTVRWQQKGNVYEGVVVKFLGCGEPIPWIYIDLGTASVKGVRVSKYRCRLLVKTIETTQKGAPIYRTPAVTREGEFKGEILD